MSVSGMGAWLRFEGCGSGGWAPDRARERR
jgi:hypothetical protein